MDFILQYSKNLYTKYINYESHKKKKKTWLTDFGKRKKTFELYNK